MSVRILKNNIDITSDNVKLARSFGQGLVPDSDIVENYVLEYVRGENDRALTVKFPELTRDSGVEVQFLNVNEEVINGYEMTFETDVDFDFSMRIPAASLNGLSDGTNKLNRQILINNTVSSGYRIEVSPSPILYDDINQTLKQLSIKLYENINGQDVLIKSTIDNPFKITYKRSEVGVRRSQVTTRGYIDDSTISTNDPLAYVIDVRRTSTAGNVDDYYEIQYNGTDLVDKSGNSLQDKKFEVRVTSDVIDAIIEEVRTEYITRLVNEFEEELNAQVFLDAEATNGIIDIPSVDIRMYIFDPEKNEFGAELAQDDVESYYLEVTNVQGVSSFTVDGTNPIGGSTEQTQIFGPFTSPVQIMGALQEFVNNGQITLRHYAILKERTENGGLIGSQNRTQEVVFNFTKPTTDDGTIISGPDPQPGEVVRVDPTTLVRVDPSTVTFVRAEELDRPTNTFRDYTPAGAIDLALTQPDDPTRRYFYELRLDYPFGTVKDGTIQYRRPPYFNRAGQLVEDEYTEVPGIFGADTKNNKTSIRLPFEPYGGKTSADGNINAAINLYEFQTLSIEDPESILTDPQNQQFSMNVVGLPTPQTTDDDTTPIIPEPADSGPQL